MRTRGFTLIEVLVALVIVAFGMGAVLAALSSAADNIAALREKTLAEWVALNQVADTRLNLNIPQPGVSEGDVKGFANADWHWRQDIVAVDAIPGMIEIAVRVRRLQPGDKPSDSSTPSAKTPTRSTSSSSSGAPGSFFSSSSGSSSGFGASGLGQLTGSSGSGMQNLGASKLPGGDSKQNWVATVIGFRGSAVAPASGEQPDWSCLAGSATCNSSSSGASSSSSGSTLTNPNGGAITGSSGTTSIIGSSSGP
jgi:type II secretion system protein I